MTECASEPSSSILYPKTYSVNGLARRICDCAADITSAIRKVHDFFNRRRGESLAAAGAYALSLPESYYINAAKGLSIETRLYRADLQENGFKCEMPQGAYYVMTDISDFKFENDVEFTKFLIREIGVSVVPGSSFYHDKNPSVSQKVRFCFCKKDETLEAAGERLQKLKSKI